MLWDSGSQFERTQYADELLTHLDPALPVVDIGCGNGTHTRWLAGHFPSVLGVDVSAGAVERARHESADIPNAEYAVLDAAAAGAGRLLLERLGPANVFVRGVFHVLKPNRQASLAANLHIVLGEQGNLFLAETNFRGNSLGYLAALGATRAGMPSQLQRALENLPRPGHFGAQERSRQFPADRWRLIIDDSVEIEVVSMNPVGNQQRVPGYFAILAPASRPPNK
ncbi:class I SAM-dependent methyltransferase [Arthrobacter sp. AL12]|uniref:class I SAM-dependent methyltransferase n=1 Tax=Arthrobacter sp. AL12 TaxID=3042241 RepID=UPI00249BC487|nr:class I SAM-dependent methyltransferase [Arthrobacter sp. AL12]MDI3212261.1 methyltransferase domain-containing protein [Arthrobacter sp. AL12]